MLVTSKSREITCDKALQEAQVRLDRLVQRQSQRQLIRDEYLKINKADSLYDLLAELLGPKKLQRELLRCAEREIVDLANEILDRVSGGQLELVLAQTDNEYQDNRLDRSVLQLEARNRSTESLSLLGGGSLLPATNVNPPHSSRTNLTYPPIFDGRYGLLDPVNLDLMIPVVADVEPVTEDATCTR